MEPQHDADSPPPSTKPSDAQPAPSARGRKFWRLWPWRRINPFAVAAVVLFALLAAVWIDSRKQIHGLQQDLIRKLAEADVYNRESRQVAGQARDAMRELD